ncbi:hypothetical protein Acid7E03_32870 [Acidisoma sp. 7E03]
MAPIPINKPGSGFRPLVVPMGKGAEARPSIEGAGPHGLVILILRRGTVTTCVGPIGAASKTGMRRRSSDRDRRPDQRWLGQRNVSVS